MLIQSTLYVVPAILLYDRFNCETQKNNYTSFNDSHQTSVEETKYQNASNII